MPFTEAEGPGSWILQTEWVIRQFGKYQFGIVQKDYPHDISTNK